MLKLFKISFQNFWLIILNTNFYFVLFFVFVCFFVFYYSYFFVFLSVVITIKLSFYFLFKATKFWWYLENKWFISYAIIVNCLFYGMTIIFYIYFFTIFGIFVGSILTFYSLWFHKYKSTMQLVIDLKQQQQNIDHWSSAVLLNLLNFIGYNWLIKTLHFNFYVSFIKVSLLVLLAISLFNISKEIKKYKLKIVIKKIMFFCWSYPGYAVNLLVTAIRMAIMVKYEIICLRYGIAGYLLMGGPSICFKPNSVIIGETVQNIVGVSEFKPVMHIEPLPTIPNVPPKDVNTFVALVANNPQGINISESYAYYKTQYEIFQRNNIFKERFPDTWEEFVSCIRGILLDAYRTENPNFNMIITNQQVSDYINTKGQPIQAKTVEKITITTIQEALQRPGALQACKKENMAIHIFL
jgi:hypothetical protein